MDIIFIIISIIIIFEILPLFVAIFVFSPALQPA